MHLTMIVLFLILWGLWMMTSNTMDGSIHIFLLGALGVMILSLIQGPNSIEKISVNNQEKFSDKDNKTENKFINT